jgi:hypothetical protein
MARRRVGMLVAMMVTTAYLAPAVAAHGAVAAKTSPDPCALITSAATNTLANPRTVSEMHPNKLLKGNCNYSLQGTGPNDGSTQALQLFVESLAAYKLNQSLIHKTKPTKGVGVAGYTGVDGGGNPVLGFKTKNLAIRITGDFDAATLLALAKGINTKLK